MLDGVKHKVKSSHRKVSPVSQVYITLGGCRSTGLLLAPPFYKGKSWLNVLGINTVNLHMVLGIRQIFIYAAGSLTSPVS